MPLLQLPATLAFVVVSAGAMVTAACDGGGGKTADAGQDCRIQCLPSDHFDDGGLVGDAGVTCPTCADEMGECPSGCYPIGLV
jgi:hypothetical protein